MNVKMPPTMTTPSTQTSDPSTLQRLAEAVARTPPTEVRNLVITAMMEYGIREDAITELVDREGPSAFSSGIKRIVCTEGAELKPQWVKLAKVISNSNSSTVAPDIRLMGAALLKMAGLVWFIKYVNSKE